MDRRRYVSVVEDVRHSARLWMAIAVVLLLSNVMLAAVVVMADTREKTIIVPPHFDKPFSVRGNELSPAYVEQMSRYVAQLLLTYNKQTARSQFAAALQYFDTQGYGDAKAALDAELRRIERNDLGAAYYVSSIEIDGNTARITGTSIGILGKQIVSREPKTYSITFDFGATRLYISHFSAEPASPANKREHATRRGS